MPLQCSYVNPDDDRPCYENAYQSFGQCLFHMSPLTISHPVDKEAAIAALKKRLKERLEDTSVKMVDFAGAMFTFPVVFGDICAQSISFMSANFMYGANFNGAEFKGESIVFDNAQFPAGASFNDTKFLTKETSFNNAHFIKQAFFNNAKFYGEKLSFDEATFSRDVSFKGAKINCSEFTIVNGKANSNHLVSFEKTIVVARNLIDFSNLKASGQIIFNDSAFTIQKDELNTGEQRIDFKNAILSSQNSIGFVNAKFDAPLVNFQSTTFDAMEIIFDKASFLSNRTSFENTVFGTPRNINGHVSFNESTFESTKEVSFESANFISKTYFNAEDRGHLFVKGVVKFKNIKDAAIQFKWVNLGKTEFLNTDISRFEFIDVTWDHDVEFAIFNIIQSGKWRSRLYEERLWREKRKKDKINADKHYLTQLSILYRALKDYYRKEGLNSLVGGFHYGLMEVTLHQEKEMALKKAKSWFGRYIKQVVSYSKWQQIYRAISRYSEDPNVALAILALLILDFGFLFWWVGVPSEALDAPMYQRILHSMLFSIQAGTLSRIDFYKGEFSLLVRCFYVVESILIPVQFAFLVMALRNRFRRWS